MPPSHFGLSFFNSLSLTFFTLASVLLLMSHETKFSVEKLQQNFHQTFLATSLIVYSRAYSAHTNIVSLLFSSHTSRATMILLIQ